MSHGKTHKGIYVPKNPDKWIITESGLGGGKIVYRSSWERKFIQFADNNINIKYVASEPFPIPYISPVDNKQHRYYIDFVCSVIDKDGNESKKFIEIKPKAQTKPPRRSKNKVRYVKEMKTWLVNKAKWEAAKRFCEKQGWEFLILTEHELGIK